jgi:lysophospholipase L1-like esterase
LSSAGQSISRLTLEEAVNLNDWEVVPITPQMIDSNGKILIPTGDSSKFYRMRVDLIDAPELISQPSGVEISGGETATLAVVNSGSGPVSYQWYEGPVGVTTKPVGTDSPTFTTPVLYVTRSYWVRLSNIAGTIDSDLATVSVNASSPKPTVLTISALGDSITGGVTLGETRSIATMGSYLAPSIFFDTGLKIVTSAGGTNFQTGGFSVQQIIDTWLPQVLISGTDLCVVHAGTNSLNDALASGAGNGDPETAADWLYGQFILIMDALEDAGIHCVICTITPDDHTTTTPQMRMVRAQTNSLIRGSAQAHGAVVCDWAPELSTEPADDTAVANTLYLRDNVHPSACGAWRMGRKLVETLKANFTIPGSPDYPPAGDEAWLTPNPYLEGDVSGLATSFTTSRLGVPAVTITPNKTSEGWQRLHFSEGGAPGTNVSGTLQIVTPQFTDSTLDGRRFKAVFDVRPVQSDFEFFAIRPTLVATTFDGGTSRNGYAVSSYGSTQMANEKTILDYNSRFIFETPVMEHPGGTGTQRRQLIARLAFWGSGSVDVRMMGVIEVE